MKIVFVSRLYLPHLGGVEIHLKEVSAILVKLGHEVSIVTSQHDKKLSLKTEYDGVKVYRIPFQESVSKRQTWNSIRKYQNIFLQADIVHIHDVFWWILPFYLKIRKKIFITFHGWETKFPVPINAKIHRFLASILSKKIVHVGDFVKKFYFDKPDYVVYGGINPKRFTKINQKVKNKNDNIKIKHFVFVGRLDQDTDILLYIQFLNELSKRKILFDITWVGDGKLRNECEKIGKVTGFIKNISQYIVDSDLVFASSYLSILEAQMLEKVVCAFYSNPLKREYLESFPGSKFMLVAGNVQSMINKLEYLYSSSVFFEQTKKKAKVFATSQTWKSVVDIYLKMYE